MLGTEESRVCLQGHSGCRSLLRDPATHQPKMVSLEGRMGGPWTVGALQLTSGSAALGRLDYRRTMIDSDLDGLYSIIYKQSTCNY